MTFISVYICEHPLFTGKYTKDLEVFYKSIVENKIRIETGSVYTVVLKFLPWKGVVDPIIVNKITQQKKESPKKGRKFLTRQIYEYKEQIYRRS